MTSSITPTTAAMEGKGFYNRNSAMQAAGIAEVLPLWHAAAQKVPIGEEPLVVADYGSSQGHNSMEPVSIAIDRLRERAGEDRPIEVVHTDLPSNDFSSLFDVLLHDPQTYLADRNGIFPSAIGRSYFEPLLPPGRVHLAWNSWTLQWMSVNAADAPDHVFAARSKEPAVLKAVRDRQAKDWSLFLRLRSLEMRPGGRLLCMFPGADGAGWGWNWLGGELWKAVLEMARAGELSEEECLRITIPTAPRALEAIAAPFEAGGRFCDLEIEHLALIEAPDPCWPEYLRTHDSRAMARSHAGMMRGFSGPTIRRALDPERDREAVIDRLFARFAEGVAASPQKHEHYLAVVVLAKLQ